jgi:hypothetical protein
MTEPVPEDDARPWESPGALRRDCEPHRGPALLLLASGAAGTCGLACPLGLGAIVHLAQDPRDPATPVIAVVTAACAAAAAALAVGVWRAAGRDLALMRAGRKDPGGRRLTAWARRLAQVIVALPPAALAAGLLIANWP